MLTNSLSFSLIYQKTMKSLSVVGFGLRQEMQKKFCLESPSAIVWSASCYKAWHHKDQIIIAMLLYQ